MAGPDYHGDRIKAELRSEFQRDLSAPREQIHALERNNRDLLERVRSLEEKVSELRRAAPVECDRCQRLFASQDSYSMHACEGA